MQTCDNCGKQKGGNLTFCIGAKSDKESSKNDWVMVHGTGKLVCSNCYPAEKERASALLNKHIADHNARVNA